MNKHVLAILLVLMPLFYCNIAFGSIAQTPLF